MSNNFVSALSQVKVSIEKKQDVKFRVWVIWNAVIRYRNIELTLKNMWSKFTTYYKVLSNWCNLIHSNVSEAELFCCPQDSYGYLKNPLLFWNLN